MRDARRLPSRSVIRCNQPRTLDLAAIQGRRQEAVPTAIMAEVLARVITFFE